MRLRRSRFAWLAVSLLCTGCSVTPALVDPADPLPSWREGAAKQSIVAFIDASTSPRMAGWIPPAERIAVFDHDGTLIVEEPLLVQEAFIYWRIRQLAAANPQWVGEPPFSAVLEGDYAGLKKAGLRALSPLMDAAQSGMHQEAFQLLVRQFLAEVELPVYGRRAARLVYQPMIELIELLHARDFRVFIVSGGGTEFIRGLAESVYGIPRERVIGSSMKARVQEQDGVVHVMRRAGIARLNVGKNKVQSIQERIGRRPALAVGNADGDREMLHYAGRSIVLKHDDATREAAYARSSERLLAEANSSGWITVSMANDFLRVFPRGVAQAGDASGDGVR